MDITNIKINEKDYNQFIKYLDNNLLLIEIGVSIIIFKLNRRDTTFNDIVKTVKSYHEDFVKNGEIRNLYLCRDELSDVATIFFQEFADSLAITTGDYQEQSVAGAYHFCTRFIEVLYKRMKEQGLFDNGVVNDNTN